MSIKSLLSKQLGTAINKDLVNYLNSLHLVMEEMVEEQKKTNELLTKIHTKKH